MTPEEIVAELQTENRKLLDSEKPSAALTLEQVRALMDVAAMQGFRLGSNVSLSMVRAALAVQLARSNVGDIDPFVP